MNNLCIRLISALHHLHQSISLHVPNYYSHLIRIQEFPKVLVLRYGWYPIANVQTTNQKNEKNGKKGAVRILS